MTSFTRFIRGSSKILFLLLLAGFIAYRSGRLDRWLPSGPAPMLTQTVTLPGTPQTKPHVVQTDTVLLLPAIDSAARDSVFALDGLLDSLYRESQKPPRRRKPVLATVPQIDTTSPAPLPSSDSGRSFHPDSLPRQVADSL